MKNLLEHSKCWNIPKCRTFRQTPLLQYLSWNHVFTRSHWKCTRTIEPPLQLELTLGSTCRSGRLFHEEAFLKMIDATKWSILKMTFLLNEPLRAASRRSKTVEGRWSGLGRRSKKQLKKNNYRVSRNYVLVRDDGSCHAKRRNTGKAHSFCETEEHFKK